MLLSKKAKKINEGLTELVDLYIKNYANGSTFTDMSTDDFLVLQKSMKLMEDTMDLMVKEAEALDNINLKLDKLLESK